MGLLAVLLFMVQDLPALREEARAAEDFRADELRARIFRETAGKALSAKLEQWSPGIETSSAWEHDSAWTRLFLELPYGKDDEGKFLFAAGDFERLFPIALRGRTWDDDIGDLLERISYRGVRGTAPEVAGLLRDRDPETRRHALEHLRRMGEFDAVPDILPLLGDPDPEVRIDALGVLSGFRAKAAVPAARKLLSARDPETRAAAASALARIGDRESIPALVDLLRDPDPGVRRSTVGGLVELDAWRQFSSVHPLLADPDSSVREAAVRAAERLAGADFPDLVRPLLRDASKRVRIAAMDAWGDRERDKMAELIFLLRDEDTYVRNAALNRIGWTRPKEAKDEIVRLFRSGRTDYDVVSLLGDMGATETLEELFPLLRDKEKRVQEHVALALGKLGGRKAVAAILGIYKDPDDQARAIGTNALRRLSPREAEAPLLELLSDPNVRVRGTAATLLAEHGLRSAVPRLRSMLNRENDWIGIDLGVALAKLGDKEGIEELRRRLKTGRAEERGSAANRLFELGAREALPDMIEALTYAEGRVRVDAVEAVEAWGRREDASKIVPLLGDKRGHWEAIHAMVRLSYREAAPRLVEHLDSPDGLVRARVAWALARLGSSESVPAIRKRLADADPYVRAAAVEALAGLADAESIPTFRKLLGEEEGVVRAAAARALGDLAAREAIPDLVRATRDREDWWVWMTAAEALAGLGELEPAFERLRAVIDWPGDPSPALARRLIPEGTEGGFGRDDFAMNFVRRPMVWKKLEGKRFVRTPTDRLGEALERIAREVDLALEWPPEVETDRDVVWASQWKETHRVYPGRVVEARPRSELLTALEQSATDAGCAVILEDDRIRLLKPEESRKFWRNWHLELRKPR